MTSRRVIATLAHPLAQWPTAIAQWSTNGAVPVELRACLSVGEFESVIATGTEPCAVLLDGGSNRVGEHAIAVAVQSGATPIGVDARDVRTDWEALGVASVLHADFSATDLMDLLDTLADDVRSAPAGSGSPGRGDSGTGDHEGHASVLPDQGPGDRRQRGTVPNRTDGSEFAGTRRRDSGTIISVCGPGGCGTSVISMAIAQGIALDPNREQAEVLLVDGARRTNQALYHHTGDVLPALGDLVNRVRSGTAGSEHLERGTFGTSRGYRLLAGAPTPRDLAGFDSGSMHATLGFTACGNDFVIVDHDGDLPGGPVARAALDLASLWVVVTRPGLKGVHDAVRFTEEACTAGVPPQRVVVVCNQTQRRDVSGLAFPAEFARLLGDLDLDVAPTIMVPRLRTLEATHRDATPLPRNLTRVLTNRIRRLLERELPPRPSMDRARVGPMATAETR